MNPIRVGQSRGSHTRSFSLLTRVPKVSPLEYTFPDNLTERLKNPAHVENENELVEILLSEKLLPSLRFHFGLKSHFFGEDKTPRF